jgi:hypothetical protein
MPEAIMADRDARAKLAIYHTIYRLNLSFANIVANCRALGESGILSPKFTRLYQSYAQELQAEINEDVVAIMDEVELRDMHRFGKVRLAQNKARNHPLSKALKHSALSRALPARKNRPHLTPPRGACEDDDPTPPPAAPE